MKNKSLIITSKEIKDYINSGQFYIVTIAFLIITGWVFVYRLFLDNVSSMQNIFGLLPFIIMIFIPLLTMGSFAYEKESGTIESLLTMPFKDFDIILGKFAAITVVFALTLVSTVIYPITLSVLGSPDIGQIFSGYFGILLVGMTFISAGLFASSITNNQITGFIIAFIITFTLIFVNTLENVFQGVVGSFFKYLSVYTHYYSMTNGVIDSKDIIYFASVIAFFLFLVKISLESRKW